MIPMFAKIITVGTALPAYYVVAQGEVFNAQGYSNRRT